MAYAEQLPDDSQIFAIWGETKAHRKEAQPLKLPVLSPYFTNLLRGLGLKGGECLLAVDLMRRLSQASRGFDKRNRHYKTAGGTAFIQLDVQSLCEEASVSASTWARMRRKLESVGLIRTLVRRNGEGRGSTVFVSVTTYAEMVLNLLAGVFSRVKDGRFRRALLSDQEIGFPALLRERGSPFEVLNGKNLKALFYRVNAPKDDPAPEVVELSFESDDHLSQMTGDPTDHLSETGGDAHDHLSQTSGDISSPFEEEEFNEPTAFQEDMGVSEEEEAVSPELMKADSQFHKKMAVASAKATGSLLVDQVDFETLYLKHHGLSSEEDTGNGVGQSHFEPKPTDADKKAFEKCLELSDLILSRLSKSQTTWGAV